MKHIFSLVIGIFLTVAINAGAACNPDPYVKVGEGSYFVSNTDIQKMGGDLSKPINWSGDANEWDVSPTVPHELNGVKGVLVENAGSYDSRWNLVQDIAQNDGWLYIERLIKNRAQCAKVYTPRKLAGGNDLNGSGPAFWDVPESDITMKQQ